MITGYHLATLNAILNTGALTCVWLGYRAIRARDVAMHQRWMLAAVGLSVAFLASYLARNYFFGELRFPGTGIGRYAYLALLASHVLLAVVIAPLVVYTVVLGLKDQRERHRRIARRVLPVWSYVLASGVLVYLILYQLVQ
jgi:putative membrane protein